MLLIERFTDCALVVYGQPKQGDKRPFGTAFMVHEPIPGLGTKSRTFIVTARHVIERVRRATADGIVYIRANHREVEQGAFDTEISIEHWAFHPEDDEDRQGDAWLRASSEPRYDVAIAGGVKSLVDNSTIRIVPSDIVLSDPEAHGLVVGDDVALTGLYHQHIGKTRNVPIVRSGMIAADRHADEPVLTGLGPMAGAYLIETRSTGGLSGSPVFWVPGLLRRNDVTKMLEPRPVNEFFLIGMIQGHYDTRIDNEKLNDGIAVVAPARHIVETIRQEAVVASHRDDDERLRAEESGPALDALPEVDPERSVSLAGIDPEDALRALLKTPPHRQDQP